MKKQIKPYKKSVAFFSFLLYFVAIASLCVFTCVRDYASCKEIVQHPGTLVAVPGSQCFPVQINRRMDVCLFLLSEQLSCFFRLWKCCLTVFSWDPLLLLPPIMQLQNRKTNSGNRPQNAINFGKGWVVGPVTGYYYCRRKTPNQLQIPSCLVSVTVANYKWTPRYSFTSFAAHRMDLRLMLQSSRRTEKGGR